jgi:uncharacterized cofD-like protein
LEPFPKVNPRVIDEIVNADLIAIGPGGLHTSLIPNLLVEGVCDAICKSAAKKIFVVNLMNRKGQTTGYKTSHYLQELVRFIGKDIFDHFLINIQKPPKELIEVYAGEGELVENDLDDERVIFANLLGRPVDEPKKDLLKRNLIRHDSKKLAQELMKIVDHL